MTKVVRWFRNQ